MRANARKATHVPVAMARGHNHLRGEVQFMFYYYLLLPHINEDKLKLNQTILTIINSPQVRNSLLAQGIDRWRVRRKTCGS